MKYDKRILITGILLVICIALVVIGFTYAFFTAGVQGNPEATQSVIETADLKLIFNDTEVITMNEALPGVSQTKTFTISNTGNKVINYDINVINLTNTFINDELVYSLTSTNGGTSITNTSLPSANGTLVSGSINPGITQTYTMTILFKETGGNQNANQGAIFTGKLQINTQSAYSDEVVFSIESTSGTINLSETKTINIVGNYYGNVTCISDNTNIAECTPSQNQISILVKSPGTTNITVKEDNKNMEVIYTVTVTPFNAQKGVNIPVLVAGMTPVKWTGNPGSYVESTTTADDPEWYDYGQKKWANAKTVDGSYWVWIPRYAYKITTGYHTNTAGNIDVKFLMGSSNKAADGTTIETSGYNADTKNTSMHYFTHPAFTFGSDEVTGIWIAKYEASVADTADVCNTSESVANCNKNTLIPAFKPSVKSWRYINNSNIYDVAFNLRSKSNYGWQSSAVDTHMMKNTELGAISYLSKSIYGANQEIWINNSSTYTTGCAGNSVSEAEYAGCQNAYNTSGGIKASTTHNITGIYDISGGAYEKTAAYVNNGDSALTTNGNSIVNAAAKYKDVYTKGATDDGATNYTTNKDKYGDAIWETSNAGTGSTSWYADYSYMAYSTDPWFYGGGSYGATTDAGAFYFDYSTGAAYDNDGFRASALIPGS